MQHARRSVSPEDLAKYMAYKRNMERRLGMADNVDEAPVVGLDRENRPRGNEPAAAQAGTAQRNFGTEAAAGDDGDIYE